MKINVIVQYNGGILPNIILLTQASIFIWFDGTIIVYYFYPLNYVYIVFCFVMFGGPAWRLM